MAPFNSGNTTKCNPTIMWSAYEGLGLGYESHSEESVLAILPS